MTFQNYYRGVFLSDRGRPFTCFVFLYYPLGKLGGASSVSEIQSLSDNSRPEYCIDRSPYAYLRVIHQKLALVMREQLYFLRDSLRHLHRFLLHRDRVLGDHSHYSHFHSLKFQNKSIMYHPWISHIPGFVD